MLGSRPVRGFTCIEGRKGGGVDRDWGSEMAMKDTCRGHTGSIQTLAAGCGVLESGRPKRRR